MLHRGPLAIRISSLLLLCLAAAWGFQPPRTEDRVLPDLDSRAIGPGPVPPPDTVQAALNNFRVRLLAGEPPDTHPRARNRFGLFQPRPELHARFDPLSGGVRLLLLRGGFLTGPSADSPEQIGQRFLNENPALFALAPGELATIFDDREYAGLNDSLTHVFFRQGIGGVPVFGADVRFHITATGQIALLSSSVVPVRLPEGRRTVPASDAVRLGAADIRPDVEFEPEVKSGPTGAEQVTVFDAGPFRTDITARLVWFPLRGELTEAWRFQIAPTGFPQAYDMLVDAFSGEVLFRRNLYQYADADGTILQSDATQAIDSRLPDPQPTGNFGCPPADNHISRSLNAQFRSPDTVIRRNGRLHGNNVHVFRTSTGNEGAFAADLQFDFPFNSAESAETNLFFAVNFLHDFFYDLGFDEPSGNFQEDNFGLGGAGDDNVNANARAEGRNNSTSSTPADGSRPTINTFLWDGSGCWGEDVDGDRVEDLDGVFDLDIIIHEYHHGVSNRLNTRFSGAEAGAMGEGGGDFFAYSINRDTTLGEYAVPPSGIRQVNSKTYADWSCSDFLFCGVHANGEIWANVLWDLRERFRTDRVNGSEELAVQQVHQLYVNGLKLSPAGPTMLELRDAILQDDLVRNPEPAAAGGSANFCRIWQAFAGRGMGEQAQDTKDTGTTRDVVADSSVPADCGP